MSYLCEKKWLIITLAWLGYFPIIFNDRLSKFQMRLNSWPFILHSLRAVVFLIFYAGFLLINANPNTWKVVPVNEDSNQTDNLQNNNSLIQLSYKFDFRVLVDYSHLILLISYVSILCMLCRQFSKHLTELCKFIQELDTEVLQINYSVKAGFAKIYVCIVLELICHLGYLILETIVGISNPEWWRSTIIFRLYVISAAVVHVWISTIQILFEVLLTISCLGIKQRLKALEEKQWNIKTQNLTLSLLVLIMEMFQSTFGGIMALHLSVYTVDLLSTLFTSIILGARGDYILILISIFYLVGRALRVYNIASVCDQLSYQIFTYSEHLDDIGVDMRDDSRERKVLNHKYLKSK